MNSFSRTCSSTTTPFRIVCSIILTTTKVRFSAVAFGVTGTSGSLVIGSNVEGDGFMSTGVRVPSLGVLLCTFGSCFTIGVKLTSIPSDRGWEVAFGWGRPLLTTLLSDCWGTIDSDDFSELNEPATLLLVLSSGPLPLNVFIIVTTGLFISLFSFSWELESAWLWTVVLDDVPFELWHLSSANARK